MRRSPRIHPAVSSLALHRKFAGSAVGLAVLAGYSPAALAQCFQSSQIQELLASDRAPSDEFGQSCSISGTTAVIGAHQDDNTGGVDAGAAYVFILSGTTWTQQAQLLASDRAAGDLLGRSVAISGDTAVVGAPNEDNAGGANAGAAYVFIRTGTVWTQQAKLTASVGAAGDLFGTSVAILGENIIVGASNDANPGGAAAGAAYVFTRSGTTWTQQQKLEASDGAPNRFFGSAVAITSPLATRRVAVVGAPGGDHGAAYVFSLNTITPGSTWNEQQKLVSSQPNFARFGSAVAVVGTLAIVGEPGIVNDKLPTSHIGAAYVFSSSITGATWTQAARLTAFDGIPNNQFGTSVAYANNMIAVGAFQDTNANGSQAGAAYLFTSANSVWSPRSKLVASNGGAGDEFGRAIGLADGNVIIGAPEQDQPGINTGSAYVFKATWLDIIQDPSSVIASPCGSYVFNVAAAGVPAISYQWQYQGGPAAAWTNLVNGPNLVGSELILNATGATAASLSVNRSPDGWAYPGTFRCILTNECGTVTSDPATMYFCYANCDCSTGSPLLTANDFQCFLNSYAANSAFANCDQSTGAPELTANDFACFLNRYAQGCTFR